MKPNVAFICVHNSCRSQIAEALGKLFAFDVFESYSAGTELKQQINQDAVKVVKELYRVDLDKNQYPKLITDLPDIDITIKILSTVRSIGEAAPCLVMLPASSLSKHTITLVDAASFVLIRAFIPASSIYKSSSRTQDINSLFAPAIFKKQ